MVTRRLIPFTLSQVFTTALLVAVLASSLSCRRGDLQPDGDPDALTLKAQQDEIINSPSPAVALSGDYRLQFLRRDMRPPTPDTYEYFPTLDEPETAPGPSSGYTSTYHLLARASAGKDSIRLVLDGDGYLGKFDKYDLGTFNFANYRQGRYAAPPTDERTDDWQLGIRQRLSDYYHQLAASRSSYAQKTTLFFGLTLGRVINKADPRYGKIVVLDRNYDDFSNDYYLPLGKMTFGRKSVGVLAERK